MKTVLQNKKKCIVCGMKYDLQSHHVIFGVANRRKSEKYGLKVWLCAKHHTSINDGVHFNRQFDLKLKQMAQKYFEENIGNRDEFRREFGKSFL